MHLFTFSLWLDYIQTDKNSSVLDHKSNKWQIWKAKDNGSLSLQSDFNFTTEIISSFTITLCL